METISLMSKMINESLEILCKTSIFQWQTATNLLSYAMPYYVSLGKILILMECEYNIIWSMRQ